MYASSFLIDLLDDLKLFFRLSSNLYFINVMLLISTLSACASHQILSSETRTQIEDTQIKDDFRNTKMKANTRMQSFELHSVKGVDLKSDWFKGKKIILHYFTTWCRPCSDQTSIFNQLQTHLLNQNRTINWEDINQIAIQFKRKRVDEDHSSTEFKKALGLEIKNYIQNHQADFFVIGVCLEKKGCHRLPDFRDVNKVSYGLWVGSPQQRFGNGPFGKIDAIPTTYLINSDGKLYATIQGMLILSYLIEQIQQMR